ncbi:MAG: BBP7 family outer membrane beta-barrel protein [Planctomycetaceae bacterium]|nr:BBP7 family outer membrane beta-barrel protein [Planctomycetales bacterium]MCB9926138.1 BBP7 family outer membrane beta-barrel protein [Planctomycetaceae bacterium]
MTRATAEGPEDKFVPEFCATIEDVDEYPGGDEYVTPCTCGCTRSWYADAEFLLAWRRGRNVPSLVTTSPAGTPAGNAGVLPGATPLFGGGSVGQDVRSGGRVTVGKWLDACKTNGVEGRFWMLGANDIDFATDSSTYPILARPYFDAVSQTNEAILLAYPGFTGPGNVRISGHSEVLGSDFLYRTLAAETCRMRLDLLAGYQYSRINEDININSMTTAINVPVLDAGTTFTSVESFRTSNDFHGGQIGLSVNYFAGCDWQVDVLAKVAFGNMRQVADIAGQATIVTPPPGSTTNATPGPLAGPANSGRFTRNRFAVAPEVGVKLRRQVSECLDLSFGYSYQYWSDVIQPGDQIDFLLRDPTPAFQFRSGSYWVQSLTFGATVLF